MGKVELTKAEDLAYRLGYAAGFDNGLSAASQCANCEFIGECPDDNKANYCIRFSTCSSKESRAFGILGNNTPQGAR